MVVEGWKIKIKSNGQPVIVFGNGIGRQDTVLEPVTDDVKLTDKGISFTVNRRGTLKHYECRFDKLGYTAPPTLIAQLRAMKCIVAGVQQKHILSFLYEFISGVLTEVNPYIIKKQPFDMYVLAENYSQCKQLKEVNLQNMKMAVLDRCHKG